MSDWFSTLAAGNELPVHAALELEERGFVVLPGMVAAESLERLTTAYTEAVTSATGDDIRVGRTSTKVSDFVNRGAAFDNLYVFPPLLETCCQVIGGPFKLSSFHARTLRQGAHAQDCNARIKSAARRSRLRQDVTPTTPEINHCRSWAARRQCGDDFTPGTRLHS